MSNSLQPRGLQHARLPCPLLSPGHQTLTCIESVMPSNRLVLCRHLLLLPSIFPGVRVFTNVSAHRIRQPKYWSFSFSISPSNEYSGLISFRMDWFDLLAVQGTFEVLVSYSHYFTIFIYWAVSGLSCVARGLPPQLMGSLGAVCWLSCSVACGVLVP